MLLLLLLHICFVCRLLTLVGISKWLMASVPSHTSVNTCSGLVTLYALTITDMLTQAADRTARASMPAPSPRALSPAAAGLLSRGRSPAQQQHPMQHQHHWLQESRPQAPVLPDLLLIASSSLACPGILAEAAQLLLAALLHPAAPGTFMVPALSNTQAAALQHGWVDPHSHEQQQQQQLQQVFTSPGAAAAASCWPSSVLQLAVLQAQQQQQQQPDQVQQANSPAGCVLSLQQLPLWLPRLVLSAAGAVAHPSAMPPELLAAVSACLLDVLLGAAPANSSCVAASWLCQVLRGGHWALWRPCLGKPGHLVHRWVGGPAAATNGLYALASFTKLSRC